MGNKHPCLFGELCELASCHCDVEQCADQVFLPQIVSGSFCTMKVFLEIILFRGEFDCFLFFIHELDFYEEKNALSKRQTLLSLRARIVTLSLKLF